MEILINLKLKQRYLHITVSIGEGGILFLIFWFEELFLQKINKIEMKMGKRRLVWCPRQVGLSNAGWPHRAHKTKGHSLGPFNRKAQSERGTGGDHDDSRGRRRWRRPIGVTACGRWAGRGGRWFRAAGAYVGAPPRACRSGGAGARRGEGTARPVHGACVPAGPVLTTRLLVLGGRHCQVVNSVRHRLGREAPSR